MKIMFLKKPNINLRFPVISFPSTAKACVLLLIVLSTLFRILAAGSVGLGYGESYYFSCALRPSLSYFDQPPLAILITSLSLYLSGQVGPLIIRLPFVAMFAGTTWLMFMLGKKLFGPWPGFYAALLLNLSAVFTLSTGMFFQPDGPLMFFWLACVGFLIKIFFDTTLQRPYWWWAGVGFTLGMAMLSKYHAVFLMFGAGMFAMTSRNQRHWIYHPGPYVAICIAFIIFMPTLVWNYQNNWISFLWQGNRGLDNQGIHLDWLFRSILGQALWLLPWIWVPLLWELFKSFRHGAKAQEKWFIGWMSVGPIVLFTTVSAYASIGFHFHWQAPGYLILFLLLGDTIHKRLQLRDNATKLWLRSSAAFTCVVLILVTTHTATGWGRSIVPNWLEKKTKKINDPTLEALDYTELEAEFDRRGYFGKENLFVFTNRWFQSGKVDYALKGKMPVLCFHSSDTRSFSFFNNHEEWLGKDGILVSTKKYLDDPVSSYGKYFSKIYFLGMVKIHRGRHVEETLYLHYCQNFHTLYPLPY